MGSALSVLRALLESQCALDATGTDSDPSSTTLNDYVNKAIRKIARIDQPRELLNSTVITADVVSGQNTVSIPATVLLPTDIWLNYSSTNYRKLTRKPLKDMIQLRGPVIFYDSSSLGNPDYYDVRGTSFIFDRYFKNSVTAGLKIWGITPPTSLASDSDTTELPIDYDLLVAYEAATFFYQKENEDGVNSPNFLKFSSLARAYRAELKLSLDLDTADKIELDPTVYQDGTHPSNNPGVFFTS